MSLIHSPDSITDRTVLQAVKRALYDLEKLTSDTVPHLIAKDDADSINCAVRALSSVTDSEANQSVTMRNS